MEILTDEDLETLPRDQLEYVAAVDALSDNIQSVIAGSALAGRANQRVATNAPVNCLAAIILTLDDP